MVPSGKARARKSEVRISCFLLHSVTFKLDVFFCAGLSVRELANRMLSLTSRDSRN
jgi:hypothetical protein